MRKRPKKQDNPPLSHSAARDLDARLALERSEWERETRPKLQREAARRGCALEWEVETVATGDLVHTQSISHRFKRLPRVPKPERAQCGAKCRDGHACRARVCNRDDGRRARRCRLHGGLSTGPRSIEGRERIAESNRRRAKIHND